MLSNLDIRKAISIGVISAFLANILGPMPFARADEFRLPAPGVMVRLSPPLIPPMLKGIKVHPDNPFRFEFILDQGDSVIPAKAGIQNQEQLKTEATRLIKYFLVALTIPEKDLWVNLSPYEKDRIIPQSFGLTEMGRDLLGEDYMLKQITASLIYPGDEVGKKFWKRIYEEAEKKFGTTNIPVNTFNKVWIVPEKAVVYENAQAGTAYVVESKLKVMLEQDYLALSKNNSLPLVGRVREGGDVNALGSQIVREIVIPELSKEVNEDKNFAQLRQVYNSLILATWYKKKIKDSILEQVYMDKNKIAGVGYRNSINIEAIYQRYLQAFKKGVFNYIKEDVDPITQETVPRKYFSGGETFLGLEDMAQIVSEGTMDSAMHSRFTSGIKNLSLVLVTASLTIFLGVPHTVSAQSPLTTSVQRPLPASLDSEDFLKLKSILKKMPQKYWSDNPDEYKISVFGQLDVPESYYSGGLLKHVKAIVILKPGDFYNLIGPNGSVPLKLFDGLTIDDPKADPNKTNNDGYWGHFTLDNVEYVYLKNPFYIPGFLKDPSNRTPAIKRIYSLVNNFKGGKHDPNTGIIFLDEKNGPDNVHLLSHELAHSSLDNLDDAAYYSLEKLYYDNIVKFGYLSPYAKENFDEGFSEMVRIWEENPRALVQFYDKYQDLRPLIKLLIDDFSVDSKGPLGNTVTIRFYDGRGSFKDVEFPKDFNLVDVINKSKEVIGAGDQAMIATYDGYSDHAMYSWESKLLKSGNHSYTPVFSVGPLTLWPLYNLADMLKKRKLSDEVGRLRKLSGNGDHQRYLFVPPISSVPGKPVDSYSQNTIIAMLSNQNEFKKSIVIDLGAGSGLLSLVALSLGASRVFLFEKNRMLANIAQSILEAQGYKKGRDFEILGTIENSKEFIAALIAQNKGQRKIIELANLGPWEFNNTGNREALNIFKDNPIDLLINAGYTREDEDKKGSQKAVLINNYYDLKLKGYVCSVIEGRTNLILVAKRGDKIKDQAMVVTNSNSEKKRQTDDKGRFAFEVGRYNLGTDYKNKNVVLKPLNSDWTIGWRVYVDGVQIAVYKAENDIFSLLEKRRQTDDKGKFAYEADSYNLGTDYKNKNIVLNPLEENWAVGWSVYVDRVKIAVYKNGKFSLFEEKRRTDDKGRFSFNKRKYSLGANYKYSDVVLKPYKNDDWDSGFSVFEGSRKIWSHSMVIGPASGPNEIFSLLTPALPGIIPDSLIEMESQRLSMPAGANRALAIIKKYGMFFIHGNLIFDHQTKKGILVTGMSGLGKSTITSLLIDNPRFSLIADDGVIAYFDSKGVLQGGRSMLAAPTRRDKKGIEQDYGEGKILKNVFVPIRTAIHLSYDSRIDSFQMDPGRLNHRFNDDTVESRIIDDKVARIKESIGDFGVNILVPDRSKRDYHALTTGIIKILQKDAAMTTSSSPTVTRRNFLIGGGAALALSAAGLAQNKNSTVDILGVPYFGKDDTIKDLNDTIGKMKAAEQKPGVMSPFSFELGFRERIKDYVRTKSFQEELGVLDIALAEMKNKLGKQVKFIGIEFSPQEFQSLQNDLKNIRILWGNDTPETLDAYVLHQFGPALFLYYKKILGHIELVPVDDYGLRDATSKLWDVFIENYHLLFENLPDGMARDKMLSFKKEFDGLLSNIDKDPNFVFPPTDNLLRDYNIDPVKLNNTIKARIAFSQMSVGKRNQFIFEKVEEKLKSNDKHNRGIFLLPVTPLHVQGLESNFKEAGRTVQSKALPDNVKGGIDLTPANMRLQTQNNGVNIKFQLNPALLEQLRSATGFVPVIINIQPLKSVSDFLGVSQR